MPIVKAIVNGVEQLFKFADDMPIDEIRTALQKKLAPVAAGVGLLGTEEEAEAGVITKGGKKIISAWHGTPHTFPPTKNNPLGEFDAGKVGTGEGAQAYGHGAGYLADVRGVSEGYRDVLSPDGMVMTIGGKDISPDDNVLRGIAATGRTPEEGYSMLDNRVEQIQQQIDDFKLMPDEDDLLGLGVTDADVHNMKLDGLKKLKKATEQNRDMLKPHFGTKFGNRKHGSLYQVEVDATPDELLDWDKTLGDQPQSVKDGLSEYIKPYEDKYNALKSKREALVKKVKDSGRKPTKEERTELTSLVGDITRANPNSITGERLYSDIQDKWKPYAIDSDLQRLASDSMNKKGIKGIQYNDGMSRGVDGGSNSKNYVIFDAKIMRIAKKYGIAPAAVTSAMIASEDESFADTMNTMSNEIPLRSENTIPAQDPDDIKAQAYKNGNYGQAKPIADGWRGAAYDAGSFMKQHVNLPLPFGMDKPLENAGDLLMNIGTDQKKDLLSWWWDSILAASDVAP